MNTLPREKVREERMVERYVRVRKQTEAICAPLETEDYVVQPIGDVSPPKWHLGHTTWFFETFVLLPNLVGYKEFDPNFNYVFNSYYETLGARVIRTDRGNMSRPTVSEVFRYRHYVDEHIDLLLGKSDISKELCDILELGLQHEQQHQELLYMDIKYILGHNPLFPAYSHESIFDEPQIERETPIAFSEGACWIGHKGKGFCFDNEKGRHLVYLDAFEIAPQPVSNGAYMEFMEDGGYSDFRFWHASGWDWVNKNQIKAPLYWHWIDGQWMKYGFKGLEDIDANEAVCHISYYEAAAFAAWKGKRLPTEMEWELASNQIKWGHRWEWTESAYLPYPKFKKAKGAIGEYNGKFMVDQMVLRGASVATPKGHSRRTYRNFFQTDRRWQFSGVRLAQ
ncbi:ergothioneine biosynthesis protein EgtB [Muricauda oceani]|uniref:Ergothioneine biosynthesis protein EgtB n=1 Tax=Flagellimonas oceani TaxID=2698672 RepID=A0A6G7IZD2_9FLAO|nr:ergothioneine biosynthesis protein EgtB [Allomuricauda oceani]MBW8243674.1 ergothioneine biosynthesis protein EgtB [Allomuricauda oceani]QII43961.1 ergothioneine biosynthesis protein EgtB [Allomuricauda oceani]